MRNTLRVPNQKPLWFGCTTKSAASAHSIKVTATNQRHNAPYPFRLTLGDNSGCRSHEANSDVDRHDPPLRDGRLRREPANIEGRAGPSRSGRTSRRSGTTGTAGASCALASGSVARDPRPMRSSRVCRPVCCRRNSIGRLLWGSENSRGLPN